MARKGHSCGLGIVIGDSPSCFFPFYVSASLEHLFMNDGPKSRESDGVGEGLEGVVWRHRHRKAIGGASAFFSWK